MDIASLVDRWGRQHFVRPPNDRLQRLPLSRADRELLTSVGLPIAPKNALHLQLRFESVDIRHQPENIRLLTETEFERTAHFPKTGYEDIDQRLDLSQCVVIGEVPNDFGEGAFFLNRFVCVAGECREVYWIYPNANDGVTECCLLNTTLVGYLRSLLAYKDFRDEWRAIQAQLESKEIDGEAYSAQAHRIHKEFVRNLEGADPTAFERGFWSEHAGNEALLM